MKYKLTILFLLNLCVLRDFLYAQNNTESGVANSPGTNVQASTNVIPPSPDAFNFTRYGNVPVGLFTGTAQYSLPVYTISCGKLIHNISLKYATNGIKVDEMAGRTGLGWTLTAGGSITRIVQGLPDEFSSRVFNHVTPSNTDAFYSYVRQASYASPPDFQPDEYSFNVNGISGKFIKGEDGIFKILSASKVQIQQDSYSQKFILTGTDGTKYFFNDIEYTKNYSIIPPAIPENIPTFTATAWYISKIISQTNDSLVFNYNALTDTTKYFNGISQEYSTYIPGTSYIRILQTSESGTFYSGETNYLACLDPQCLYLTTTMQATQSFAKYLSSIDFNNGKVEFITSTRQDVTGERKIDSIKIKNANKLLIKCFSLSYDYSLSAPANFSPNFSGTHPEFQKRLFLKEFHEVPNDSSLSNKYLFSYDDANSLPPRLSFCQDKFGYFNGRANQYFFPNDTWFDWWIGNNHLGGDRSYDFKYARKGVLTNIQYPTGGSTTIEYEPQMIKGYFVYKAHDDSLTVNMDTSNILNQIVYTDTFYNLPGRELKLNIKCNWASTPAPYFPEAYYAYFDILDASTNQCVVFCQVHVLPGNEFVNNKLNTLFPGTGPYKIRMYASQARLRIKATVHKIFYTIDSSQNVGIAGLRVKSMIDYREGHTEANRREFIYGDWDNPSNSSGSGIYIYADGRNYVSLARKFAARTGSGIQYDKNSNPIYDAIAANNVLHSNSVRNTYLNENGTVTYSKVIELNNTLSGNNNGGTEYNFYNQRKTPAKTLTGALMSYVWSFSPFLTEGYPLDNDDFLNGLTMSSKTFTYTIKFGARNIINETFNYYSNQELGKDSFFLVQQVRKRDSYDATLHYFADYDINKYFRYYGWVKLDSSIEKSYAQSISSVNRVDYVYSAKNYQVNEVKSTESNGNIRRSSSSFPTDVISTQPNYSIYSGMTLKNIIDPAIDQKKYINSYQELRDDKTNYNLFTVNGKSFYLPSSSQSSIYAGTPANDITIDQYDEKGNILQFTTRDGITNSIIWGYNKIYPVAKIAGNPYNNIIAASGINLGVVENPANDNALRAELNKLRNVTGCMVTSYTYSPLIGITSVTDQSGKIVFYEYDNFNRLLRIRDKDNNIIKQYSYYYAGGTSCSTANCTAAGNKCINNYCTQGTRVNTASVKISGQWQCTYHYEWSDGTSSSNYVSLESNACIMVPLRPL